MQGLHILYRHTGRHAAWAHLVTEIVPLFVDPTTDGPLPDREDDWSLVTGYRVSLANASRQWAQVEHLQRVRVDWNRHRAADALALPPDRLTSDQRNTMRTLAISLYELGEILREQAKPDCVAVYEESQQLALCIIDLPITAAAAFNLGHAFKDIPTIRDYNQAEHWYRLALSLYAEADKLGRGQCLVQLGVVAYHRFQHARRQPEADPTALLTDLNVALDLYHQALTLLPPTAVDDLAVTHTLLGNGHADSNDLNRALTHWREAARCWEVVGNNYGMAQTLENIARGLASRGRFADALPYAEEALHKYASYESGAPEVEQTQELIANIKQDLATQGGSISSTESA
jgi:tetratricopeptide (TPR) repeat protein